MARPLFGQFPGALPQRSRSANPMNQAYHPAVFPPPATTNQVEEQDEDDDESIVVEDMVYGDRNYMHLQTLSKSFAILKQENESIKNAIVTLQDDRDKLRMAVRKLKVENSRFKAKLKRMSAAIASHNQQSKDGDQPMEADATVDDDLDDDFNYEDIGEFLLIGGLNDPFSAQYRAPFRDGNGSEHKTVERYVWYKMAETFEDKDAMAKILNAEMSSAAEEAAKNLKNFDQKAWDAVKMCHWEDGQRLKFDQYRSLKCLLIKTGKLYLAIASQDKFFGTGWRKFREEAARPHMWDGENRGGKFLMKLRDEFAAKHTWTTEQEEKEAQSSFYEKRRNVWRRQRPGESAPTRGGGGGRGRGHGTSANVGGYSAYGNIWSQPFPPQAPFYMGPSDGANVMWTSFEDYPKRRGGGGGRRGPTGKRGRF